MTAAHPASTNGFRALEREERARKKAAGSPAQHERSIRILAGGEPSGLGLERAATGRRKLLKFECHYHGWDDSVLISDEPLRAVEAL